VRGVAAMELEMPLTPTVSPRAAGLSGEHPAMPKRRKSPPNFVLAGLVPAIHALEAVEGKTWMRGSSPRKTTYNRFLSVRNTLSLWENFPRTALPQAGRGDPGRMAF